MPPKYELGPRMRVARDLRGCGGCVHFQGDGTFKDHKPAGRCKVSVSRPPEWPFWAYLSVNNYVSVEQGHSCAQWEYKNATKQTGQTQDSAVSGA